ncbi:NUMOD3 domain-containing DNA-binding protein [Candidatus Pacearchaeota archaeon]|jgi:5-methylcytosine-specific restriction endonuclease McrA|nr:NUMOD3 domain-containing DNA-binding protein [Candidatus Pacearchaeota archaeon]
MDLKLYQDEDLLRQKYLIEMKPAWAIAQELQTSKPTILAWLRKYNIPIRRTKKLSASHIQKAVSARKANGYKHSDETKRKISEARVGWEMPDDVKKRISETLNGHPYWSIKHHSEESKRKIREAMRGEKCHLWKGGKSFEPYCQKFNNGIKEEVRNSFGRKCFLCGTPENGMKLDVHHVDYNKGQGCGQKWNLIPLCHSCHTKTTDHRAYYFNLLMNYWAMNPDINFGVLSWIF